MKSLHMTCDNCGCTLTLGQYVDRDNRAFCPTDRGHEVRHYSERLCRECAEEEFEGGDDR